MDRDTISEFMDLYKLTPKKLATAIGVDPSYLSLIMTGKRKVTDSLKYKIEKYGELLSTGGTKEIIEQWTEGDSVSDASEIYSRRPARGARPPSPARRQSSHLAHIIALLSRSLEDLPAATYDLFPVEGTSMIPTVCEGDELLCKQVTLDEIIDGRVYVLVLNRPELNEYRESGIWVKRVYHRKSGGYLTCKSDNKETTDPYFTFKVKATEVQEVWYIVRRFTGVLADPNRDIYERLDEMEHRIEMLEADAGME